MSETNQENSTSLTFDEEMNDMIMRRYFLIKCMSTDYLNECVPNVDMRLVVHDSLRNEVGELTIAIKELAKEYLE